MMDVKDNDVISLGCGNIYLPPIILSLIPDSQTLLIVFQTCNVKLKRIERLSFLSYIHKCQ